MIRCPLCAQLVHLNDSGVPVCGTPGCGDIPILDSQRDRRITLEAAVESVIHGPGYACTLSDLGINPAPQPSRHSTLDTFSEGGVVHYFLDGKEIARQALENMPRVLREHGVC